LSSLLTASVVGFLCSGWMIRRIGLRFDVRTALRLARFGLPYKATQAGTFVLTFGDRFFLKAHHDLAVVGLYGLAYQFGFVLVQLSATPIMRAWNPQRFAQASQPRAIRDKLYDDAFLIYNLAVITTGVMICLFVKPVLLVMAESAFWAAAAVVPVIIAAQVAACWISVLSFGIDISEKTEYMTYATLVGVAAILLLYALLIPDHGALGAATATLLAFLLRLALVFRFAQRLWPITYRWSVHLRLVAYGAGIVLLHGSIPPQAGPVRQLLLSSVSAAAYALVVWHGRIMTSQQKGAVVSIVRRLRLPLQPAGKAGG
jgi:O-antigen/teichoic acid export membrane protein